MHLIIKLSFEILHWKFAFFRKVFATNLPGLKNHKVLIDESEGHIHIFNNKKLDYFYYSLILVRKRTIGTNITY